MAFTRGDIVEVYFKLPNNKKAEPHPALIISNDDVIADDDCYIMVMLTGTNSNDKYSYHVEDRMLNKPLPKKSQVRCHLITYVLEVHITNFKILSTMKPAYVDAIVSRIVSNVLSV